MNIENFDALLDAYLLGDLSLEEASQLRGSLQTDPAARSCFVRNVFIETGLHHLARRESASVGPRQQSTSLGEARRHRTPDRIVRLRRWTVAAIVLVAIGAIAVWRFARQDSTAFARVASGKVLVDGQPQDRLADGATLSVTGPAPAVIDLSDGSRATLDPATQLTIRGRVDSTRQVLQLAAGGGQFQVPNGGGRFRIDSPAGSVTVLGTEFTAVLRSPRTLFLSVAAGSVRFDGSGSAFTLDTGQSRTFGPEPDTNGPKPDAKAKPRVMEGRIHSVDLKAGTFVLVGEKESKTTFTVGVKRGERREDCLLLFDGKPANPTTAMKPDRKASVTYVPVGDDLGALKVEVTSGPGKS